MLGYEWLYKYRVLDLPWDSLYTWWAAFFFVDFCYYWVHRANHGEQRLYVLLLTGVSLWAPLLCHYFVYLFSLFLFCSLFAFLNEPW